jgi:hypothetical protein
MSILIALSLTTFSSTLILEFWIGFMTANPQISLNL